jgi:hypothetical protein
MLVQQLKEKYNCKISDILNIKYMDRDKDWIYHKATDTRAILFWRWQCNGGKIVALPSQERNCLCIILCDGNAKLRAIVAEISNHLIFGNDCRKLGGVVKEGLD